MLMFGLIGLRFRIDQHAAELEKIESQPITAPGQMTWAGSAL